MFKNQVLNLIISFKRYKISIHESKKINIAGCMS